MNRQTWCWNFQDFMLKWTPAYLSWWFAPGLVSFIFLQIICTWLQRCGYIITYVNSWTVCTYLTGVIFTHFWPNLPPCFRPPKTGFTATWVQWQKTVMIAWLTRLVDWPSYVRGKLSCGCIRFQLLITYIRDKDFND